MKQCNLVAKNKTLVLLTLTISILFRYFIPTYSTKKGVIVIKLDAIIARFRFFERHFCNVVSMGAINVG